MSSKGFEPPLRIEPRPSVRALWLLVIAYGLATGALISVLPGLAAVPVGALAGGALVIEWRRARRREVLEWSSSGEWWFEDDGPWQLRPATVLTPWLVVLVLGDGRRLRRIALFPDALPATDWRRLRARLRRHPVAT